MTLLTVTNLIYLILAILIIIGGYIALRYGISHTAAEVQEKVINALKADNERLQNRLEALEDEKRQVREECKQIRDENKQIKRLMLLVVSTLKKARGIDLDIDYDDAMVTLRDAAGQTSVSLLQEQ